MLLSNGSRIRKYVEHSITMKELTVECEKLGAAQKWIVIHRNYKFVIVAFLQRVCKLAVRSHVAKRSFRSCWELPEPLKDFMRRFT